MPLNVKFSVFQWFTDNDNLMYVYFVLQRVLQHQEDSSLLKAYIAEWGKFFTQCDYLPKPFMQLVTSLAGKPHGSVQQKKTQGEETPIPLHPVPTPMH